MKRASAVRVVRRAVTCAAAGVVLAVFVAAAAWWDGALRDNLAPGEQMLGSVDSPVWVSRGGWGAFEMRQYRFVHPAAGQLGIRPENMPEDDAPGGRAWQDGIGARSFMDRLVVLAAVEARLDLLGGRAFLTGGDYAFDKNFERRETQVRSLLRMTAHSPQVEFRLAGWPLRYIQHTRASIADAEVPVTDPRVSWLAGPSLVVGRETDWPVRVFPLLMLANAVLFGGVLLFAWEVPPAARRWTRRQRGLCAGCGYDMRGAGATAMCPECGAGVRG